MPGPDEYFYVGSAGKLNAIYYAPLHKGPLGTSPHIL